MIERTDPFEALSHHPLTEFVSAAVPLRIMMLQAKGGPSDLDIEIAQAFGQVLGEKGDVLLFGSNGKKGQAADLANSLAQALAVMSFFPGGVKIFGQHFEAAVNGKSL